MPSRTKYSDEHRIFLQGIMCKGVLNDHEVNNLHDKALRSCGIEIPEKKSEKMKMLVENIMTINDEIKKVGLSIRKGQDEDSGKSCFMLINLSNRLQLGNNRELAAGVQCQWSPQQLEYLRLLATEIILSEDKLVTSREALNLTNKVAKDKQNKKMTMEKAEETINKLMEARWIKVIQGNLTLDVRFLGEMESWMVEVVGAEPPFWIETAVLSHVEGRCRHGFLLNGWVGAA